MIGSYALTFPVALRLPDLLTVAAETDKWKSPVIAAAVVIAVGAPRAFADVKEIVRAIRSGK